MSWYAVFVFMFAQTELFAGGFKDCASFLGSKGLVNGSFNHESDFWDISRVLRDGHSFQILPAPLFAAQRAGRFEIRKEDTPIYMGRRSELRDPFVADKYSVTCNSFSTLVDESFVAEGLPSVVLAQWHEVVAEGSDPKRPPLSIRVVGNEIHLILWNDEIISEHGIDGQGKVIAKIPLIKGEWFDWGIIANWSSESDGFVEFYVNGKLQTRFSGPTGYKEDEFGPYFKLGIYTVHDFKKPLVVWHKEYQRSVIKPAPFLFFRKVRSIFLNFGRALGSFFS